MGFLKYGWIAVLMVGILPTPHMWHTFTLVWSGMSAKTLGQAALVVVLVITTAIVLCQLPYLRWSWLSLLSHDGTNLNLAPLSIWWLGPIFALCFLVAVPSLALWEEQIFRLGVKTWWDGAFWAVAFGLSHCLVGVPIGAGLAIAIGGAWFTHGYFVGGVGYSTIQHTAYNSILGAFLLLGSCVIAYGHVAGKL